MEKTINEQFGAICMYNNLIHDVKPLEHSSYLTFCLKT